MEINTNNIYPIKKDDTLFYANGISIEKRGSGMCFWKLHGKLHRENKPAFIDPDNEQRWYLNGKLHRENGPAIIQRDLPECQFGYKAWYLNGKLHRENDPAYILAVGSQEWWINGEFLKSICKCGENIKYNSHEIKKLSNDNFYTSCERKFFCKECEESFYDY